MDQAQAHWDRDTLAPDCEATYLEWAFEGSDDRCPPTGAEVDVLVLATEKRYLRAVAERAAQSSAGSGCWAAGPEGLLPGHCADCQASVTGPEGLMATEGAQTWLA